MKEIKYKVVSARDMPALLTPNKEIFFDTETNGLYGKVLLAQFYQANSEYVYIIIDPSTSFLRQLLLDKHIVCHNACYDISCLQIQEDITTKWLPAKFDDTQLAARLYFTTELTFSLLDCTNYLGLTNLYKCDKPAMQKSFVGITKGRECSEEHFIYAATDVVATYHLYMKLKDLIDTNWNYALDIIASTNFLTMQSNGMPVDLRKLYKAQQDLETILDNNGLDFNVNSPQQCSRQFGTDNANDTTLAYLEATGNTLASKVRLIRKTTRLLSFIKKYYSDTGRIFGKFSAGARSGRASCSNQNLQQIPRKLKNVFGVDKNKVLVYADYSQLELRCIASITDDKFMVDKFKNDIDVHTYTAKVLFSTENPDKEQRAIAKTCNFGLLYGIGDKAFRNKLLKDTGVLLSIAEIAGIKYKWLDTFKEIKAWQIDRKRRFNLGITNSTATGRKYKAKTMNDFLNIEVSGLGADIAKLANHYINKNMLLEFGNAYKDMQSNFIHDSYMFEVDNNPTVYTTLAKIIAEGMVQSWENITKKCKASDIPMPVNVLVGSNWAEVEEERELIYTYKI